jgi:hypothetical protein
MRMGTRTAPDQCSLLQRLDSTIHFIPVMNADACNAG